MDPITLMMQAVAPAVPMFPPGSRYYGIETGTLTLADGRKTVYLRRRFVPPPEQYALLQEHVVLQGERLDNIAAHYLGNPEQFWQLCDANRALHPDELTETVGRRLRITLPQGIPGMDDG